jgi:chemotaxis protein MotA
MDITTIFGLLLAAGGIIGGQLLEGGHLGSLLQLAAFLIVLGGTLGAVMVQSPLKMFLEAMRMIRWVLVPPRFDPQAVIDRVENWAAMARKEGLLALENQITEVSDPFTRTGLQMLVDGFEAEKIHEAMDVELSAYDERQRNAARVWEAAGGYSPTIGILGAVLGLIHVMENLSDPSKLGAGIAVAFVATIYGVGLANLVFLPISNKLKNVIRDEIVVREMLQDGLVGIANGENPRLIVARLQGYLR